MRGRRKGLLPVSLKSPLRHHGDSGRRTSFRVGRLDRHDPKSPDPDRQIADARRREMAIEHLLFGTIRFVSQPHPELLDQLDASLDHLWDKGPDGERDDEAVREIARRFIKSLHGEIGGLGQ